MMCTTQPPVAFICCLIYKAMMMYQRVDKQRATFVLWDVIDRMGDLQECLIGWH